MTIFDPEKLTGLPYHLRHSPPEELALHRRMLDKFELLKREWQTVEQRAAEKSALEKSNGQP